MAVRPSTLWVQACWPDSDQLVMERIGFLLVGAVLSLVVACGGAPGSIQTEPTPPVERSEPSVTVPSSTTTTFTVTASTVSSSSTTDTSAPGGGTTPAVELVDLGLEPGTPVDPREDFPALADLDPSAFGVFDPAPHLRARISSRIEVVDDLAEQLGREDLLLESYGFIITYFDPLIIWDYPDRPRHVETPDRGYLFLADDGTWQEVDHGEVSWFSPWHEWFEAQESGEAMLRLDPIIIGYELLADVPTVHVRWREVAPGTWGDMWLDQKGAVIRAVFDIGGDMTGGENQLWLIWDVQTLDPKDIGPLP